MSAQYKMPVYLTVKEIAALLKKSTRSIYDLVSANRIPYRRAGGTILFIPEEVDAWTIEETKRVESEKRGRGKLVAIR